jgi:hypothetical protein
VPDAVIHLDFSEGVYREQHEQVRRDLEAHGYTVEVRESEQPEYRSIPGIGVTREAWEIAVHVYNFAEDHPLVDAFWSRLRSTSRAALESARTEGASA